jgi:NAD+ synthase
MVEQDGPDVNNSCQPWPCFAIQHRNDRLMGIPSKLVHERPVALGYNGFDVQREGIMMDSSGYQLAIDPASTSREIEQFLSRKLQEFGKHGILIGLSGGLDSAIAAYLAVAAVGPGKVRLLNLPDRDSKAIHRQHAQLVASELGVSLEVRDITPILQEMGIFRLLPISSLPGQGLRRLGARLGRSLLGLDRENSVLEARFRPEPNSYVSKGTAYAMAKHRLRMLLLYQQAEVGHLMVVGAANRTELMTGTFSLWGCDHCADVMPLLHLYRTQLSILAQHLRLPESLIHKAADPDIIPGLDDKEQLLGSFVETDRILEGHANGVSKEELSRSYGAQMVARILSLVELSRPMREVPYSLAMKP